MRRHVIVSLTTLTLFSISVLFQNCGKYKPELDAASGYKASMESSSDNSSGGLTDSQVDQLRVAIVNVTTQSSKPVNNILAPEFSFALSIPSLASAISYSCKINNSSWSPCANPLKIEGLSDGAQSLSVRAEYQNIPSLVTQYIWTRDTIIPNLIFNRVPPSMVGSNDLEISFSGSDAGSGIQSYYCSLNNQAWQLCTSPKAFTDLAPGSHSFKVKALDEAENQNEIVKNWTIDLTFPYIDITKKPDTYTKDSFAIFEFSTRNGLDFNSFECQFNNSGDFTPCSSGQSYDLNSDGIYTFRVRAKNSNGYYTSITSYSFTRDTLAPEITLNSPIPEIRLRGSFIVSATVSDGHVGSGIKKVSCELEVKVGESKIIRDIQNCGFPLDLSNEMTGTYTLRITATDNIGLQSISPHYLFYYLNEETDPAFITLNLSGGAALAANVIPGDASGNLLDSYNLMGLGSKSVVSSNQVQYLGARWAKESGMRKGIKQHLTSASEPYVRVFAIPVQSVDDTATNSFDIQTYIMSAGLKGTYLRNTASSGPRNTGILQSKIFAGDEGLELPLNPLFVQNSGYFLPTLQLPETLYTFLKIEEFPMIENADPNKDSKFESIFELSNPTGGIALEKLTISSVIFNAINGNSGPASINLSGYDYRGISRPDADAKDFVAGEWIGRSLEYAKKSGKKLMIYVPTDGASGTSPMNECCSGWTANRGAAGQLLVFVIDPQSELETSNHTTDYMIGNFDSATQTANDNFWTSTDPRVSAKEKAALSVVANYLELANKRSAIPSVTNGLIKSTDLEKFVKVKRK